jgi:hypothetical protein
MRLVSSQRRPRRLYCSVPIGVPIKMQVLGEVTERPKVRHWKCRVGVKPYRGFESRPLRLYYHGLV